MSSLSTQLNQLRATSDASLQNRSDSIQAASVLFHSKVASGVDSEQIFSLASSGFAKLTSKDERFAKFFEIVLGPRFRRLDRNLLTKKENDDLSLTLKDVLALLSLYFLEEDAQKVIDYLLRNFYVHHFEAESLVIDFMHYHATPFYTRLLQNVVLKTREHYGFLHIPVSRGESLLRETIAKQINHDSHILQRLIAYNVRLEAIGKDEEKVEGIVVGVGKGSNSSSSNFSSRVRVDPTSFLQALLIDLLSVKTSLTDTFIASLIETVSYFLKRGDLCAVSFALITLASLLIRDKQINSAIIEEFGGFIVLAIGKQVSSTEFPAENQEKLIESLWKFFVFLIQRNFLKQITVAQLNRLAIAYASSEKFEGAVQKIGESYGSMQLFAVCFTAFVAMSKKQFDSSLGFIEKLISLTQSHDLVFDREEMRESLLKQIVFDRFFSEESAIESIAAAAVTSTSINVEVKAALVVLMKKHFLTDLVRYLNGRIAKKEVESASTNTSSQSDQSSIKAFMREHFPGSVQFHENVLLKSNFVVLQSSKKKNGAKEQREYLTGILSMLNAPQRSTADEGTTISDESVSTTTPHDEILDNFSEYLLTIAISALTTEQNSKTLKTLLEILGHSALQAAQSRLEADETKRVHVKALLLEGFLKFLGMNIRNSSLITNVKAEIVACFKSLVLRCEADDNQLLRNLSLACFFVLTQSDDFAEFSREIHATIKQFLPKIFQPLNKRHFPVVDMLLSAKASLPALLSFIEEALTDNKTASQKELISQGIANFLANLFDNAEVLEVGTADKKVIEKSLEIIKAIAAADHGKLDLTLLNSQICKFLVRQTMDKTDSARYSVPLLDFLLEQSPYETLVIIKTEMIEKLSLNVSSLVLTRKLMSSSESNRSEKAIAGNVKALFLINQMVRSNIESTTPEHAYQLLALILLRLGTALSQEKQAMFLILENVKKVLKRCTSDFQVTLLSDALETKNVSNLQITIQYKILLNICEVIGKHKVELAVHNPPVGRIIAKEISLQQANKQRDLNNVLSFVISQIHADVPANFLKKFVEIFADITGQQVVAASGSNTKSIIQETQVYEVLAKLRANSFVVNDTSLLDHYLSFFVRFGGMSGLLNEKFTQFFVDFLQERVLTITVRHERVKLAVRTLQSITNEVYEKLTAENQEAYLLTVVKNLSQISSDSLTSHLVGLPITLENCEFLLDHVSQLIDTNALNQVSYVLETLLLQRADELIENLNLTRIFDLIEKSNVSSRVRVLLFRIARVCENKHMRVYKQLTDLKKSDAEAIEKVRKEIVGEVQTKSSGKKEHFVEILKKHFNDNLPTLKREADKSDSNRNSIVDENEELQRLEIVHETAEILCCISQVNFKRIANILFEGLEEVYEAFIGQAKQQQQSEGETKEQRTAEEEELAVKTVQEILESKVETVFEIFAFIARRLMRNAGERRQKKLVRFSLLHLKTVFSLLPYFSEQKTSIISKIRMLSEIYGGAANLLKVLLVTATNSLSDYKLSEVILTSLHSAVVDLLLEDNDICRDSLKEFMDFTKAIFIQWMANFKIQSDECYDRLLSDRNAMVAKYLGITSKKPNACKAFVRNAAIFLDSLMKGDRFKSVLKQRLEKPGQTEVIAESFQMFYFELIKLESLIKNALSKVKAAKQDSLVSPLKKLVKVYAALHGKFKSLFDIDTFFSICSIVLKYAPYHIRSSILETLNEQLDAANSIKKKHNFAIVKVVNTIYEDLVSADHPEYFDNASLPADQKRSVQKYLTNTIIFLTTAIDKKPNLFQPQNELIDSAGLLETLVKFIPDTSYSFTMKTSLIFLVAKLAAQGNKFRVLPHLHAIAAETIQQLLGLLYFNDKEVFDKLILVVNSKIAAGQSNASHSQELAKDVFNAVKLEESVFSQPQYFKHQETILKNADSLFVLVTRSIENLIVCLKNLISPYLQLLLVTLFSFANRQNATRSALKELLEKLPNLLESRVILESILLPLSETVQLLSPSAVESYTELMEITFNTIDADTLDALLQEIYKRIFSLLDYSRREFIDKEKYLEGVIDSVENAQVRAVSALVVKTNEVQLRKFFMNIVTWSERVFAEHVCGFKFIGYRKTILFRILAELSDKMTSLFTQFFHFTFDTQVNQIVDFTKAYAESNVLQALQAEKLNRKRKTGEAESGTSAVATTHMLNLKLLRLNLQALRSCFAHDSEQFIDTARFQTLSEPLVTLFDAFHFTDVQDYNEYMQENLTPTVLALFQLVKDDYKWKSLNYSLMLKTRSENPKIRLAVLRTLEKLLDVLGERYIVLINDILPFISEMLDDLDQEVERTSKALVIKLEEISGENIREYFKAK